MNAGRGWLVPLTGIAGVVILLAGFFIGGEPPDLSDDRAREFVDFYSDNQDRLFLGAAFQGVAVTLLVFFFACIRRLISAAEGGRGILASVAFGGGLIFAAGGAFDATLTFAMAETAEDIPPQSLLALSALFENDFVPLAVGLQLFLLGVGLAAWRFGVLPKWLAGIALLLGVIAVTPIGFVSFIAMVLWIPITSILLALAAKRGGPDAHHMSESARSDI